MRASQDTYCINTGTLCLPCFCRHSAVWTECHDWRLAAELVLVYCRKGGSGSLDYQTVWHDATRWQFASKQDLDLFHANQKNMRLDMTVIAPWASPGRTATKMQSILKTFTIVER